MAIKASFTAGESSTTVRGLFQWDYGQVLEIESADLPAVVEVHFACPSMTEAIVRSCSVTNGVGTVTIPDACLEQSATITAWVYEIDGTQGRTIKTITLPITARTRPNISQDIPVEVSNRYTELITEMNAAIKDLQSGKTTVAYATDAKQAGYAASSGNAGTANHAISADGATRATSAGFTLVFDGPINKPSVELPMASNVYLVDIAKGLDLENEQRILELFYILDYRFDCAYGSNLEYKYNNGVPTLQTKASDAKIVRVIKVVGT